MMWQLSRRSRMVRTGHVHVPVSVLVILGLLAMLAALTGLAYLINDLWPAGH
jgi:hypothetical protein